MSNRVSLGFIYKSKDPNKSDYVKIDNKLEAPVTLKPGQYLSVESKAYKLANIERAVAEGKLSEKGAAVARDIANRMPDFVRGELILLSE